MAMSDEHGDRDAQGRFVRGHPGGPGRPSRQTELSYLLGLSEAVTPDVWGQIVQRAISDAIAGDAQARSWISIHLLPKAGTGGLALQAESEARQDRFERGEETLQDYLSRMASEPFFGRPPAATSAG
jgi:hypothetical protein